MSWSGAAVGGAGPLSVLQAQSVMMDRRRGLSPHEALQRGAGMAHRGITYVHMDMRNHEPPMNAAAVGVRR